MKTILKTRENRAYDAKININTSFGQTFVDYMA